MRYQLNITEPRNLKAMQNFDDDKEVNRYQTSNESITTSLLTNLRRKKLIEYGRKKSVDNVIKKCNNAKQN